MFVIQLNFAPTAIIYANSYKDKEVAERREKQQKKAEKQAEKEALLASLDRVKNVEDVTKDMKVKDLDNQLEIYRKLVDGVPQKSKLKNKDMKIEALKNAIRDFAAQETVGEDQEESEIGSEED